MSDRIRCMYQEAHERLHDADILAQSLGTRSDSQAIIRILAFEVLLKCALLIAGQKPRNSHNYKNLWLGLPGYVRKEILQVASEHMPGRADLSQVEKLLGWYQFIFEKARYHYELYENYTLDEQYKLGEYWIELGVPINEAVVQYHPRELQCLIAGVSAYVEKSF
jgi:hypothetical protein